MFAKTIDRPILHRIIQLLGHDGALSLLNAGPGSQAAGMVQGLDLDEWRRGTLTGTIFMNGSAMVKWTRGVLRIGRRSMDGIPETVRQTMIGRPVTDLLRWDCLDDAMIITSIDQGDPGIYFDVRVRGARLTAEEARRVLNGEGGP